MDKDLQQRMLTDMVGDLMFWELCYQLFLPA